MPGGRIDIIVAPDTKGFPNKLESGLKGSAGIAGKVGKGIALALAAGTAAAGFGLSAIIDKGREYEASLNDLQAVTQATGVEMRKVGQVAKDLGADMSLPATSAADAASAMVELAKGGLDVDEAMQAAKGTLQLAAAAQVDAAQAAEIQSSALNAFSLEANQAGRVADVLANTANAAAGSIVDIGNSMKFVAPVSAALGVSIEDTATAIGLLANQGVKGEQAGTSLRGILASLASPSKLAKKALEELGVAAFDQGGKFIGLRAFTDQLAKAKGRLSDAEFAAASSTAFGNEGFTAANALAAEGATAFDQMATAVARQGGAADVAAAKTKGLGGAIEGFKSQVETAGIGIFEAIGPPLEKATRAGAQFVSDFTPKVVSGIKTAIAAGQVFGPGLADAIRSRGDVVGDAVHDVLGPIAATIPGLLNAGLNIAIGLWDDFTDVLGNVVDAAKPVANGIAAVAKAATEAGGPIAVIGTGLRIVGDVVGTLSGVLVPIGKVIGGIASAFAALPGPVQSAVLALGLVAAFRGPLSSLGDTVQNRVTAPFRSMGQEIQLQKALLTGSTDIMSAQVGKFGLAMATLETRIPALQKMRAAFDENAAGADRFHRAAGLAAAAGVGFKSAAGGIVNALGGPAGLVIAGATLGLGLLASSQQKAAERAADHKRAVENLAGALREANGVITEAVRQQVAQRLLDAFKGIEGSIKTLGLSTGTITSAALKQGDAYDVLIPKLKAVVAAGTSQVVTNEGVIESMTAEAQAAQQVIGVVEQLGSEFDAAKERNKLLDQAIRDGGVSMLDATGTGKDLASAMGVLSDETASADDRARALKETLDILNGGSIDLEAAQSRLNEQLSRLGETFGSNVDKTKGWGAALINANGTINTTLPNGRALFQMTNDIGDSMAMVAQQTFDVAKAQGDDLPAALDKAKQSAQATREEFVLQAQQAGLTAVQAQALADKYGLIPELVATAITTPGMTQAQLELILIRDLVNKVPPDKPITVRSLSDEAKQKLIDLGFTVRTLPDGTVEITANTAAAKQNLNSFINSNQNHTIGVSVVYNYPAKLRREAMIQAAGGVVKAFAAGGTHKLTPMRAGLAQVVPPNTWRIIGDRIRDDEFYIPDNNSSRSMALGMEWARRRGLQLIRNFALGGIAGTDLKSQERASVYPNIGVQVFVGDREITDIVDIRIRETNRATRRAVLSGVGGAR